jgi:hypothetical protein
VKMGENGSELKLAAPTTIKLTAQVAARLNETPNPDLQKRPYDQKPYWDVERARIGSTRTVPVEALVDGKPVGRTEIQADGSMREVSFDVPIEHSSWVALRILPSSHTNPIFVIVNDKPIRSRKSIEWCMKGVDQCWSQKERFIKKNEMDLAKQIYQHARDTYAARLAEATVD